MWYGTFKDVFGKSAQEPSTRKKVSPLKIARLPALLHECLRREGLTPRNIERVSERFQNAFFNTLSTRRYTKSSAFHFKPHMVNGFAPLKTIPTTVTCSRPAPSRTLVCSGSINASPAQASQWPKSNISFREFCTHALPASPKQPTTTSFHPRIQHCRHCIASNPSTFRHCLQSRIHEVVLPASASRAYHLQPRLSNDRRRRHALAPGAFI